jgi:excisionase family DNA binding protein
MKIQKTLSIEDIAKLRSLPWGTRAEAAAILRIHTDSLDSLIRAGKIRAVHLGRVVRVDLQQVFAMAEPAHA